MRVALSVNPRSRQGARLGGTVRAELERHGIAVANERHAHGVDAIVVAGGDGSVARAIPRALALGIPLGIVPLGTFNDLARTVSIAHDVSQACAIVASGAMRRIDVGRVNGAYFTTEASIGLSSRLTRLQTATEKQRFGLWVVAASAVRSLRYLRPFQVEIAFDGRREHVKTIQTTVANSNRFGGFINVEGAAIDDGRFDCFCVDSSGLAPLAAVGAMLVGRTAPWIHGIRQYRSTAFSLWTRRPHRITADGEPAGETPARFELLPRALSVFAP